VNIKCYVLPHIQNYQLKKERRVKLKIGISWQVFYIYRQNRLLLNGTG
jgi:hypothetical protein